MHDVTDLRMYAMRKHPELRDQYWERKICRIRRDNICTSIAAIGITTGFLGLIISACANSGYFTVAFCVVILIGCIAGICKPVFTD